MESEPFTEMDLGFAVNEFDCIFTRFNNLRSLTNQCVFEERSFGNVLAFQDKNRPNDPYYNRVSRFTDKDLSYLDEIIDWYKNSGLRCNFGLHPKAQTKDLLAALYEKGFRYEGSDWIYYKIPSDSYEELPEGLEVNKVTDTNLDQLFELLGTSGVKIDKDVMANVRHYYVRPDFRFYIAYLGGTPAASASLFVYDNVGWLSNATTLEQFRGNGCQSSLLRVRENSAARQGCRMVLTDTQFGSTSHRNILRSGFSIAYTTAELGCVSIK